MVIQYLKKTTIICIYSEVKTTAWKSEKDYVTLLRVKKMAFSDLNFNFLFNNKFYFMC